jgi:hypothetical protein
MDIDKLKRLIKENPKRVKEIIDEVNEMDIDGPNAEEYIRERLAKLKGE